MDNDSYQLRDHNSINLSDVAYLQWTPTVLYSTRLDPTANGKNREDARMLDGVQASDIERFTLPPHFSLARQHSNSPVTPG